MLELIWCILNKRTSKGISVFRAILEKINYGQKSYVSFLVYCLLQSIIFSGNKIENIVNLEIFGYTNHYVFPVQNAIITMYWLFNFKVTFDLYITLNHLTHFDIFITFLPFSITQWHWNRYLSTYRPRPLNYWSIYNGLFFRIFYSWSWSFSKLVTKYNII